MSIMSAFFAKYGLGFDVALVAIMFVTMFGSMVYAPLYMVSLAVITAMSIFTATQVITIMREA